MALQTQRYPPFPGYLLALPLGKYPIGVGQPGAFRGGVGQEQAGRITGQMHVAVAGSIVETGDASASLQVGKPVLLNGDGMGLANTAPVPATVVVPEQRRVIESLHTLGVVAEIERCDGLI